MSLGLAMQAATNALASELKLSRVDVSLPFGRAGEDRTDVAAREIDEVAHHVRRVLEPRRWPAMMPFSVNCVIA